ncbi:MAG: hypothetical protein IJQ90_03355 [Alphaproteobacteria bacterium]|nr:hypothetical protein [Alphaproteobacteria bacterium]
MKTEINDALSDIKRQLNIILLNSTFADVIDPAAQISTIITFPEDIDIIKSHIKRVFHYTVSQDIAGMTPAQLTNEIYANNPNFNFRAQNAEVIFTPAIRSKQKTVITNKTEWTRKEIFAYIIANISRTMGRTVQSKERISNLMAEASMSGDDLYALNSKLRELENFFDIKIDQSMKIYNVANAAEVSFIAQGRAPAPAEPDKQKDPLWNAVMTATSITYLKSVLQHNLDVDVSVRTLSNLKSYQEFQELVKSKLKQK